MELDKISIRQESKYVQKLKNLGNNADILIFIGQIL